MVNVEYKDIKLRIQKEIKKIFKEICKDEIDYESIIISKSKILAYFDIAKLVAVNLDLPNSIDVDIDIEDFVKSLQ